MILRNEFLIPFTENIEQINRCLTKPRIVLFAHVDDNWFVYLLCEFKLLLKYFALLGLLISFFDPVIVESDFTNGEDFTCHVILRSRFWATEESPSSCKRPFASLRVTLKGEISLRRFSIDDSSHLSKSVGWKPTAAKIFGCDSASLIPARLDS